MAAMSVAIDVAIESNKLGFFRGPGGYFGFAIADEMEDLGELTGTRKLCSEECSKIGFKPIILAIVIHASQLLCNALIQSTFLDLQEMCSCCPNDCFINYSCPVPVVTEFLEGLDHPSNFFTHERIFVVT